MIPEQKEYQAIGVMSGTSLDGLDVLSCRFSFANKRWTYKMGQGITFPYPGELKKQLQQLPKGTALQLANMHTRYGRFIGEKISRFITDTNCQPDFISSHGYTVFHSPENGLTTQIGSGAEIYAQTGIKTICDFRSVDVALGGQGAPLVPVGDELLFGEYDACLNLGGFSNLSYKNKQGRRIAYDICPVNYLLNHFSQLKGLPFDENGALGKAGTVIQRLLNDLNALSFYKKPGPKSMGREFVEQEIFSLLPSRVFDVDVLRTLYEHMSVQISHHLNAIASHKVLITGGGAFNQFLISLIKQRTTANIIIPIRELINFKEALVFAFLGLLRLLNSSNCISDATGAKHDNLGGAVYG